MVQKERTIVGDATIFTDSQAAILCINGHTEGASWNLLKTTRGLIGAAGQGGGGTPVKLRWCLGHSEISGNVLADMEAARAAEGHLSPHHLVPRFLLNYRPYLSPNTCKQELKTQGKWLVEHHWKSSDTGIQYALRYPHLSPSDFISYTRGLDRARTTLLFRPITGHVPLRQHLYRLQLVDFPRCTQCTQEPETVTHFLYCCPQYNKQRQDHLAHLGPDFLHLKVLVHSPRALDHLFNFVKATGRFSDLVN